MTVKSGKHGKVAIGSSDVNDIRNWKFDMSGNVKTYASSSTSGHQSTVDGNKAGTVSFELVFDQDEDIDNTLKVGDQVTLLLHQDSVRKYTVPVRIDSVGHELNIEDGEPPAVSVEAQTHGAWTYPDGTVST